MNTNRDNLSDLIVEYCVAHGLPREDVDKVFGDELEYWLDSKVEFKRRTTQQNAALHLYFTKLAEALNDAGFDRLHFPYKEGLRYPWTAHHIKEDLWRGLQKAYLHKTSTRNLDKWEVSKVYEVLDREISERTGVHVEFPSMEEVAYSLNKSYAKS